MINPMPLASLTDGKYPASRTALPGNVQVVWLYSAFGGSLAWMYEPEDASSGGTLEIL